MAEKLLIQNWKYKHDFPYMLRACQTKTKKLGLCRVLRPLDEKFKFSLGLVKYKLALQYLIF